MYCKTRVERTNSGLLLCALHLILMFLLALIDLNRESTIGNGKRGFGLHSSCSTSTMNRETANTRLTRETSMMTTLMNYISVFFVGQTLIAKTDAWNGFVFSVHVRGQDKDS